MTKTKKLNILLISAEVAPFAKVGGLADVAGGLPRALKALGHDVRVMMPCYKMVEENPAYGVAECLTEFSVPVGQGGTETAFVKQTRIAGEKGGEAIPVYLVGNVPGSGRPGHFQEATDSAAVYTYAPEPYAFFARAALEAVKRLRPAWKPDVLHCNDWHTGLVPVYAKQFYAADPLFKKVKTVFTIHNLAYQGDFKPEHWAATGLPDSLYRIEGLEFHGGWSFMKGGLQFSDAVNTVSENYACEIQTPEYGCGLDGLLRHLARQGRLRGIVNGIDQEEFNPATDSRIAANFSRIDPSGKAKCKAALQAELKLPKKASVAVIGLISRLADQKGFDIISQRIEKSAGTAGSIRAARQRRSALRRFLYRAANEIPESSPRLHCVRCRTGAADLRGQRFVPDALALRAVRPRTDDRPALRFRPDCPRHRRPRRHDFRFRPAERPRRQRLRLRRLPRRRPACHHRTRRPLLEQQARPPDAARKRAAIRFLVGTLGPALSGNVWEIGGC